MVHNAHDFAVYEQRMKSFVTLSGEYFKLEKQRVIPITDADRDFLIEWGHIVVEEDDVEGE
jgi:hypothetical protein